MTNYSFFIKENVAPFAAKKIGVYKDGVRVGSIPLGSFKPNYGERLYRFGLLSDVHNESSQSTENGEDLINALTYFNNKEDIEFTIISGDLTQTSYSSRDLTTEMTIWKNNKDRVSPNTPVYPTTGNHDCPQSSDVDINTFFSYTDAAGIAPSSGAQFSYEITKTHTTSGGRTVTDHFLFLGMKRYEFASNTYSSTDLTWLRNKLEAYKNDRCFVITHMFIPSYAGNLNNIYPTGNWLSGTMLTQVKALVDSYPRAIWFSGHSHWKWYLQKYQDRANVYPLTNEGRNIAWTVHLPSCASPIDSNGSSRVSQALQSEGGVCDVYEDYVVIRGIEFKGPNDSSYTQRYIPIAQYLLKTAPEGSGGGGQTDENGNTVFAASIDNWQINTTKSNTGGTASTYVSISNSGGNSVTTVTLDAGGEGLLFTSENLTASGTMTIMWDSLVIESPAGTVLSNPAHYGWYNSADTSIANNKGYSITSPVTPSTSSNTGRDNNKYGCQFNVSSTFYTQNGLTANTPVIAKFTNLRYTVEGYSGTTDFNNSVYGQSGGQGTTTAKNTLIVKADGTSKGLGIVLGQTSSRTCYLKYEGIKVVTSGNTDVTSNFTSVAATSSNQYNVGAYNSNAKYQYAAPNTVITVQANNSSNYPSSYVLPLVQTASSATNLPLYVQLKGIKWSNDNTNWYDFDSNSTTLLGGGSWGKADLPYRWSDDIVSNPTTLTFS